MSRLRLAACAAAVAATAVAGGAALVLHGPMRSLEHETVNWRYEIRGRTAPPEDVAVVAIDNRTGIRLNRRLPPTRDVQAQVVRRLTHAGARVIGYDLALNGVTTPDADLAIVQALKRAPAAVVSVTRFDARGNPDLLAGIVRFSDTRIRPGDTLRLGPREGTWIEVTPRVGHLDSFPVAAAAAFRGVRIRVPRRALIDYSGPSGTVPRLSFVDVLDGRFSASAVRGKVVVVGDTAPELQDVHDVPFGKMAGPELQANAVATALRGFPLRGMSRSSGALVAFALAAFECLVLALLVGFSARRSKGTPSSLVVVIAGLSIAAVWAVAAQIAFDHGTVVDLTCGLAAIVVATVLAWVAATVLERRAYRALRRRFAAGDDSLVDHVIATAATDRSYGRLKHLIDGFVIEDRLGQGGMGVVYRAIEEALDRPVALKVINDAYASDGLYRARFLEEAQKAAAVDHPHVVPIYSMGSDRDVLYIAMRLVDGPDLGEIIAEQGCLDLSYAARLLHRVAVGLDALSSRGVVHCDVKPSNILCSAVDLEHPYLTDFGVARAAGAPGPDGRGRGGTPAYIAPEQIRGDAVGAATDVYALGAVLFHCITGSVPFDFDDTDDVLYAHATAARPKATDRNARLPKALDPLIQRAMAPEPEERFETAVAFMQAVLDLARSWVRSDSSGDEDWSKSRAPTRTLPLD